MADNMPVSPWMSTPQAAAYAGMSVPVLTRLARQKRIQFGGNGRHYKFRREFIDAFYMANGFDGRR